MQPSAGIPKSGKEKEKVSVKKRKGVGQGIALFLLEAQDAGPKEAAEKYLSVKYVKTID